MRQRLLLNLFLLLLVGALALLALQERGDEAVEAAAVGCDPDAVARIRIEREDAEPVVLAKSADGWRLEAPFSARASAYRVSGILSMCRSPSTARLDADALDLKPMGLAPPRVRVALDGAWIALGDTEPLDMRRYLRRDDTVHLVREDAYRHLAAGAAGLVDPAPLPPGARLTALRLPSLALSRADSGAWRVENGAGPVSQDAIQALLEHWRGLSALRVSRAETLPAGERISLRLDGAPAALEFTLEQDERELRLTTVDSRLTYHLPARMAEELLRLPGTAE
ncbi:MAG: DUF4340 domain-containing protein [Gammaproteobacteria bacterium]|nr:DUF4340 domain-containing protein [Gammaproteobacteria bacterium]